MHQNDILLLIGLVIFISKGECRTVEDNSVHNHECEHPVRPSYNSISKCDMTHGFCNITCFDRHEFPNGENILQFECRQGIWILKGLRYREIPPCDPICNPQCQNDGFCYSPGKCYCPRQFEGSRCEREDRFCSQPPEMIKNTRRSCSIRKCTFSCINGFEFEDSRVQFVSMICKNGYWIFENRQLYAVPECKPICSTPCHNGGTCVGQNICQCPTEFRGQFCQYDAHNCKADRLQFNGGYRCLGYTNIVSCTLKCPEDSKFSSPPAEKYTCDYSKGYFEPQHMPQCVYGNNEDAEWIRP